jgi:hypothetical protein
MRLTHCSLQHKATNKRCIIEESMPKMVSVDIKICKGLYIPTPQ